MKNIDWSKAPIGAVAYCINHEGSPYWVDSDLKFISIAPLFDGVSKMEIFYNPEFLLKMHELVDDF